MAKKAGNLQSLFMGHSMQNSNSSRLFQTFIRELGEANTRHAADRLIRKEIGTLKEKLNQPNVPAKQMREFLVRLIYCEMLGFDASFGYIQAIKFAQQSDLVCKRVGYLALSLFLNEDHQLIMLLINTLQKDLKSTNVMDICCALTVACKLIGKDMLPALLPQVLPLLVCKRDIVRKKAVMALHRFYQKSPSSFPNIKDIVKTALGDKDLGVAAASLNLLHDLAVGSPLEYKSFVPALVKIQREIIDGKFPEFNYHDLPAPWIQIKILQTLAVLGADDISTSEAMYEVLKFSLMSLRGSSSIIYAVAYEAVKTITSIYPNKFLLEKAAKCVGLFLASKGNTIKCLGIDTLAALIQVSPSVAEEPAYQRGVIDCLNDPDETLKRKTLDLLCHITNASNVESVCEKLINFVRDSDDSHFKGSLVARVVELAERYAPDNQWFLIIMNELFELAGALVQEGVAHNLMRLLAEGTEDEQADEDLRRFAVSSYMDLLEKPHIPDILLRLISWVLGEYAYTAEIELQVVLEELCALLNRTFEDASTKGWVITAIGKIIAQLGQGTEETQAILEEGSTGSNVDLRQRCSEILRLQQDLPLMKQVLPEDASCEDLEVDSSLSMLDEFVSEAILSGAPPYKPPSQREPGTVKREYEPVQPSSPFNFTPYENPTASIVQQDVKPDVPQRTIAKIRPDRGRLAKSDKLFTGVAAWGPGGYSRLREGPGSVESGERSSSSSTSSSSAKQPIKTQTNPSLPASEPRVDPHRDAMAAELFRGVSSKNPPRLPRRTGADRSGTPQPRRGARNSASAKLKSNEDLLLDLGVAQTRDSACPADVPIELLPDKHSGIVASAEPSENAPTPATAGQNRLEGGHQGQLVSVEADNTPMETMEAVKNAAVAAVSLPDLPFNELKEASQNLEITAGPSESFSIQLEAEPDSSGKLELSADSNLRVSLKKVWETDELVFTVFLTNQSQNNTPISDVTSIFEPPSNLLATFDAGSSNKLHDAGIESSKTISHRISLQYRSPALHMSFGGKVTYKDSSKTKRTLFFNHVMSASDLVLPLAVDAGEFERRWSEAAFEKRETFGVSCVSTMDELVDKTKQELRLHPVEIIGPKMIAAGRVIGSTPFLFHGGMSGATLEITVKSNNRLLNDALLRQCGTIFR